jgi:hypothetical protein
MWLVELVSSHTIADCRKENGGAIVKACGPSIMFVGMHHLMMEFYSLDDVGQSSEPIAMSAFGTKRISRPC